MAEDEAAREKELAALRAKIQDAIDSAAQRREFREQNLSAAKSRLDFDVKKLDAAIKKNEALIKKLKAITADNKDSILQGINTVNISKFISEAVDAIGDCGMKGKDIPAAVQVVSAIHMRYSGFSASLGTRLAGSFAVQAKEETEGERKDRLARRRTALRLITELLIAGVFTEGTLLVSALKEVIGQERGLQDGGATLSALLVAFAKYAGEEVLGLKPAWRQELDALVAEEKKPLEGHERGREIGADVSSLVELAEQLTASSGSSIEEGVRKDARKIVSEGWLILSNELQTHHTSLRARERDNRKQIRAKGDISDEAVKDTEKAKGDFEKIRASVQALAEAIQVEIPEFPPDPEEEKEKAEQNAVWLVTGGGNGEEEDFEDAAFDDAETRDFYLSIPNIYEIVPAILLGDTTGAAERAAALAGAEGEEGEGGESGGGDVGGSPKAAEEEEGSGGKGARGGEGAAAAVDGEGEEDEEVDQNAVERAKMDDFCLHLSDCQSRDLIDKAAQDFCYLNTKSNRKRIARELFAVPRAAFGLLPHYARFVAVLAPAMPDIAELLASMLEKEFFSYVKVKAEGVLESRIKNIRFIGEMVKFRLVRPGVVFNCLQRCLDDFTLHNIEVACSLLEVAGRFLFKTQQTSARMKSLLEVMQRLRKAKNLDSRVDTLVQNAFYCCKPPVVSAKALRKVRSMEHEYIRHLFFTRLSKATLADVVKQLRKVDWKVHEPVIVKYILKVHKMRYNQVYLLASLVAALTRFHPSLPVYVVDDLLSELRHLLHVFEFSTQQRMLSLVKFLGELYNDLVIDSHVVFDALYTLISPGSERTGPLPDPPGDLFRARLVCALLDSCGHYFDTGAAAKRLNLFLAHFDRYLKLKTHIPTDIEFTVSDTFESLRPKMERAASLEAADALIAKLTPETGAKHVYGIDALEVKEEGSDGAGAGGGGGEDEDSEGSESDDDDDNKDKGDRRAKNLLSDMYGVDLDEGEGGEDGEGEDEFMYQEEQEEQVVLLRKKEQVVTKEDEDFEKEFAKMMLDSSRQITRRNLDLTIPLDLQGDSSSKPQVVVEPTGEERVVFKMLTKKGTKATTKELAIPRESSLASSSMERSHTDAEEKLEMKRRVLQYQNEVDFQKSGGFR